MVPGKDFPVSGRIRGILGLIRQRRELMELWLALLPANMQIWGP